MGSSNAMVPPEGTDACKSLLSESQLEAAIAAAHARLIAATDWDDKLTHWREMVRLIDQRTPSRVRFLERMRGLA